MDAVKMSSREMLEASSAFFWSKKQYQAFILLMSLITACIAGAVIFIFGWDQLKEIYTTSTGLSARFLAESVLQMLGFVCIFPLFYYTFKRFVQQPIGALDAIKYSLTKLGWIIIWTIVYRFAQSLPVALSLVLAQNVFTQCMSFIWTMLWSFIMVFIPLIVLVESLDFMSQIKRSCALIKRAFWELISAWVVIFLRFAGLGLMLWGAWFGVGKLLSITGIPEHIQGAVSIAIGLFLYSLVFYGVTIYFVIFHTVLYTQLRNEQV